MSLVVDILQKNQNNKKSPIPVWIMRQAGRYLPEYLEIRNQTKNFLDLCYNPKLASEVTLQPITRFDFDAAIIFSDILVIPHALGVEVEFLKNEGPKLGNFEIKNLNISNIKQKLNPVFEAISTTRSKLSKEKALIGFSGSPWTLACYMIEGGGSKNFQKTRKEAIANQKSFQDLINILVESIVEYLSLQIESGCNVVKLFDSWAGIIPILEVEKWIIKPTKQIVDRLKNKYPHIPIICFPKGLGFYYEQFAKSVNANCIAIDQNVDKKWAKEKIQDNQQKIIQGNLDNFLLAFGSKQAIEEEVKSIINTFGKDNFIFNLGHGILPETPIENVEFLVKTIRNTNR